MQNNFGAAPSRVRLEFLDGIRGLAALYVVLHHAALEIPVAKLPASAAFVPSLLRLWSLRGRDLHRPLRLLPDDSGGAGSCWPLAWRLHRVPQAESNSHAAGLLCGACLVSRDDRVRPGTPFARRFALGCGAPRLQSGRRHLASVSGAQSAAGLDLPYRSPDVERGDRVADLPRLSVPTLRLAAPGDRRERRGPRSPSVTCRKQSSWRPRSTSPSMPRCGTRASLLSAWRERQSDSPPIRSGRSGKGACRGQRSPFSSP